MHEPYPTDGGPAAGADRRPDVIETSIRTATRRSAVPLLAGDSPSALLARAEAGEPRPDDDERRAELIQETAAEQSADGSWGGDLARTGEALRRLAELARDDGLVPDETVARALAWLRTRRGAPGRYGDTCDAERHAAGMCRHFLGGFFAPADESADSELELENGARVPAGEAASLAASSVALSGWLRWAEPGHDACLQLAGIHRAVGLWAAGSEAEWLASPAVVAALGALVDAPNRSEYDGAVAAGLTRLATSQRADGSWPDVDAFQALDLVHRVRTAGVPDAAPPLADLVRRSALLLVASQNEDGSWGRDGGPARLLIGWRTLREALGGA